MQQTDSRRRVSRRCQILFGISLLPSLGQAIPRTSTSPTLKHHLASPTLTHHHTLHDRTQSIATMPILTTLSAKLLARVMSECDDVTQVLRFASTCCKAQLAWHENALYITRSIWFFTKTEMMDFAALSKIEAPIDQKVRFSGHGNESMNMDIRRHLQPIEQLALAIQVICEESVRQAVKDTTAINNVERRQNRPIRRAKLLDHQCFQVGWRGLIQGWLLLRRFAVGYDHPSTLASVYATLHKLPRHVVWHCCYIADLVENCSEHWRQMGVKRRKNLVRKRYRKCRNDFFKEFSPPSQSIRWEFGKLIMYYEVEYRTFIHGAPDYEGEINHDDELLAYSDPFSDVSEIYWDLVRLFNEDVIRSTFGQAVHDRHLVRRRVGE